MSRAPMSIAAPIVAAPAALSLFAVVSMAVAISLLAALSPSGVARAALPSALQSFLYGLESIQANFEQQVQDAHGKALQSGHGTLWAQRPGKFRWDYLPSTAPRGSENIEGQLLVNDGKNLWLFERDLAQATVRDATASDAAAPMLLLVGSLAQIEAAFEIKSLPARDGAQWVQVTPRSAAADFARAELGFRGNLLSAMLISDKLGQTTTLRLTQTRRNPRLVASLFHFSPPAGVDVIGTVRP
jgi:outer membrane lipoprotein carrier protein